MKKQDILQSYEKLNKRISALQEDLSRLDFANLFMQYGGEYRDWETDRKSTRLNSSHITRSRMPSSA